jgi:DHA1 family bicyclomycin/chloramphenicol resistance-like MFS transporter
MTNQSIPVRSLAVLLAMLVAVAPFAIDMYLPAMQIMAADLSTKIHYVEISISTFLFGFAIGQLLGGPLSDSFGRKPLIALGLLIFSITSLMLTQTESIDQLLLLRALQAVGGGIATVNSSAIIRDLFSGDEMAKVLSMVAIVMMAAPLLAPMIGSLIISYFSWQAIFFTLATYALCVMLLLLWRLPETNALKKQGGIQETILDSDKEKHTPQPKAISKLLQSYKQVLTHRQAMGYVMAISFSFSGMFVFITASAFAYMEYFAVSPQLFPFIFGGNVLLMMLMNRVNVWALNHYSSSSILTVGLVIQMLCGSGLIIVSYLNPNLYIVVTLIMIFVGSIGLVAANATAGTLNFFPKISGTATAVIGVTEFTLGALMGILWSLLHEFQFSITQHHSLSPMAWIMTGCVVVGFLSFKFLSRPSSKNVF